MIVRELFHEVQRTLGDERVRIVGERGELAHQCRIALDLRSCAIRLGNAAAITTAEQRANPSTSAARRVVGEIPSEATIRQLRHEVGRQSNTYCLMISRFHQFSTRSARSVFHRLALPRRSNAKKDLPR